MKNQPPLVIVLLVALTISVTTLAVRAAGTGAVGVRVPYTGHLDLNGTAVTTATNMTFTIFDDATAGAQLAQDALLVTPANGLFSVVLGAGNDPLTAAELDAKELWLEIAVEGTAVGARQQIFAATQTVRADGANNFTVHGVLTATGGATVTGGLSVDSETVANGNCIRLADSGGAAVGVCGATNQAADPNGFGGIDIQPTGAITRSGIHRVFRAGTLSVLANGNVDMAGQALIVEGNISDPDGDVLAHSFVAIPNTGSHPGDLSKGVIMGHDPNSDTCTLGEISYENDVLSGNNDGICFCLQRNGVTGRWCLHPDVN